MKLGKSVFVASVTAALALAAAPAVASSPPAPEQKGPVAIAIPPKIDSGLQIQSPTATSTASTATFGWKSQHQKATLQVTTKKPVKKNGSWAFPGEVVADMQVVGSAMTPGTLKGFTSKKSTYRFSQKVVGLDAGTKYWAVARLSLSNKYEPVEQAWEISTKTAPKGPGSFKNQPQRAVEMRVKKVHIVKDGDKVGKGEARFGARLAPDANPFVASVWPSWSHGVYDYMKVDSGSTVYLPQALTDSAHTGKDIAVVEVQGFENDVFKDKWCPVEGGPMVGQQFSDNCWDAAVAQVVVELPNTKTPTTKIVQAKVYRDAGFSFIAEVEVRSWIIG